MDTAKILRIVSRINVSDRNVFQVYDKEILDKVRRVDLKCNKLYCRNLLEYNSTDTIEQLVYVGLRPSEAVFIMAWLRCKDEQEYLYKSRSVKDQMDIVTSHLSSGYCLSRDIADLVHCYHHRDQIDDWYAPTIHQYIIGWKRSSDDGHVNDVLEVYRYLENTRSMPLSLTAMCLKVCALNGIDGYDHLKPTKYWWPAKPITMDRREWWEKI